MDTNFPILELSDSSEWPKNKIGIYAICSKLNNRIYVGKTAHKKGFFGRWSDHRETLRKNNHYNPHLQNSYNKYGESNFCIQILEECSDSANLSERENFWINSKKAMFFDNGFNIDDYDRYNKRKNHYRPSKSKKTIDYEFVAPNGEIVKGHNLGRFAAKINVSPCGLNKVLRGKVYSYKGYTSTNPNFNRQLKWYELKSSSGKIFKFSNMSKFCKEQNLLIANVSAVLLSRSPTVKGWTLPIPDAKFTKALKKYFRSHYLLDLKSKNIYKFKSIRKFIIEYYGNYTNPIYNQLTNVLNCKSIERYGFKIPSQEELNSNKIIILNY